MNKLVSFENFIGQKAAQAAAAVREEQEEKRSSSANSFKALLAEYGVAEVAELTEDQRTEFFAKLRGAEVNESTFCASLEALNEAIKVSSKREANKVWNVYTKIFNEATALTTDKETHMGAIKEIFWAAMEDANFGKEAYVIMNVIKAPAKFKSFNVNVPELGNTAIQIGNSTIKAYLETVYGRVSSAGKWGGITIVEGTALYLDSIGMAGTGQALIDDFNRQFNESVVTEAKFTKDKLLKLISKLDDAEITVKGKTYIIYNPDSNNDDNAAMWGSNTINALNSDGDEFTFKYSDIEDFDGSIKYESKTNEKKNELFTAYIEDKRKPGGSDKDIMDDYGLQVKNRDRDGFDVVGYKADIEAFAADHSIVLDEITVLESKVNEAEIKSDDEFKEYAFSVLKKAFGEDFDDAKATEVVDGILGKTKGDYAKAAGMLQSSLG